MNRIFLSGLACLAALLFPIFQGAALAVDGLSGLVGMDDLPYYHYEVRGQSSVSARLSQSLFAGGATAARVAMESARLSKAAHAYAAAAQSLAFDAIAAHSEVLRRTNLLDLAKKNVEDYNFTIELLTSRVSSGIATEADIRLVTGRLHRAKAVEAQYEAQLHAAMANYEKITGQPCPRGLAKVELPKKPCKSADAAIKALALRNPSLLALHDEIKARGETVKQTRSGYFPQVGLTAGPRWHFQNTPQDPRLHGVDAFLTLQWNLFDGGATRASEKRDKSLERQARCDLQSSMESLKADVLQTWANMNSARAGAREYKLAMDSAQDARVVFYEQYLLGLKSILDLLDADNEYFYSACQEVEARADYVLANWRMLALTGDILNELGLTPPADGF